MSWNMRGGAGIVVCLGIGACQSENQLIYQSTLGAETKGVVLSEDGLDAYAGMIEQTCTIDTSWGCPIADADITTSDDERVVDHWAGETLAMSSVGVHRIIGGVWDGSADLVEAEVRSAVLFTGGPAMVYGHSGSCWLALGSTGPVQVADQACDDGVEYTVDRHTGTVYAGTIAGVFALDPAGSRTLVSSGNLVAYDPLLGHLYSATLGARTLRATTDAGEEVWVVETTGPIHAIAARGNLGEVLVLVTRPNGLGIVERRDGEDGHLISTSLVAEGDDELVVSDNGQTVATVDEEEGVDFYDMPAGAGATPVDPTPPQCLTPTLNGFDPNIGD